MKNKQKIEVMKYEYTTIAMSSEQNTRDLKRLEDHGKLGWRLVSVQNETAYLMREISPYHGA